ncbi:MAG TPA: 16S rRNA (cytosine(967)-C(5))-methyltransferase RsmB [Telluria sp.]|nr:16S rRNA (cytosine(967)-C(5))-methyltransferase RsmB [Telluria sp.]
MTTKRPTLSLKAKRAPAPAPRPSYAVKPVHQTAFRPDLKGDSLAFALVGAAHAVAQVRAAGVALPQALAAAAQVLDPTPQARGAMQDIAYRTMRRLGRAETLLALMAPKAPEPPMLAALLCCALALIDVAAGEPPPYEPFTVVDQAVTAAGAHPDLVRAKGMVNAVLRRFLREQDALLAEALKNPVAQWNYPQWWIDAVRAAYPQDWEAILQAGNEPPPLTLRVNARAAKVAAYLDELAAAGIGARQVGPSAVRLDKPVPVGQIPGFAEGRVSVQDAGAQLAAPLLDVAPGMRVLDACAAPGGKTGHILETAPVDLVAVDADPKRLDRVRENLERLHLAATLKAGDAQARAWWDGQPFDRIVADVPCTASGILRRHPDIRWLRRKSDTLQLATLSGKILDNLWQMLKPDGKLLFVTCSLWPQESEAQAAAFAVRHGAKRLPAPGQLLPTGGAQEDHDGLFYALFQKSAA